jgi:hypothetical protein
MFCASSLDGGSQSPLATGMPVQRLMTSAKPRLLPPMFMTSASMRRDAAGRLAR